MRVLSTSHFSRWLPRLAALAAALVGIVNVASSLTPNIHWRGHALLELEPVEAGLARSASHHVGGLVVETATLLAIASVIFRPRAAPRWLPGPAARATAAELVRRHGTDTLSFFKLRGDKQYFFSADQQAFVG